jgi:hypothetical protein
MEIDAFATTLARAYRDAETTPPAHCIVEYEASENMVLIEGWVSVAHLEAFLITLRALQDA